MCSGLRFAPCLLHSFDSLHNGNRHHIRYKSLVSGSATRWASASCWNRKIPYLGTWAVPEVSNNWSVAHPLAGFWTLWHFIIIISSSIYVFTYFRTNWTNGNKLNLSCCVEFVIGTETTRAPLGERDKHPHRSQLDKCLHQGWGPRLTSTIILRSKWGGWGWGSSWELPQQTLASRVKSWQFGSHLYCIATTDIEVKAPHHQFISWTVWVLIWIMNKCYLNGSVHGAVLWFVMYSCQLLVIADGWAPCWCQDQSQWHRCTKMKGMKTKKTNKQNKWECSQMISCLLTPDWSFIPTFSFCKDGLSRGQRTK